MIKKLAYGFVVMAFVVACASPKANTDTFQTGKLLDYAVKKTIVTMNSLNVADSLPRNIYNTQNEWNKVGIHDWTSGFWPGILWLAYETTGNQDILDNARKYSEPLKGILKVPVENHDLGFMLFCSMGNGNRLIKNEDYKNTLLSAADSLVTLYNPKVGTILSWPVMTKQMNWPHNTIIDNMINLELLFWAAKNGGDQRLYNIAVKHAETSMNTLIRADYSTFHVAVYDTTDGHFMKGVTHQGYADSSMWARGQGWGIYGYTMTYRETGDQRFLDVAMKLADKFLERLPDDGIPYWDFDDPAIPNAPKDASAACVASSGLLELSTFITDEKLKAKYKDAAVKMLSVLSTDKYLANDENQAFLLHSTGHHPIGSEIDASIIYADYYYFEALLRLKKINENGKL